MAHLGRRGEGHEDPPHMEPPWMAPSQTAPTSPMRASCCLLSVFSIAENGGPSSRRGHQMLNLVPPHIRDAGPAGEKSLTVEWSANANPTLHNTSMCGCMSHPPANGVQTQSTKAHQTPGSKHTTNNHNTTIFSGHPQLYSVTTDNKRLPWEVPRKDALSHSQGEWSPHLQTHVGSLSPVHV